MGAVILGKKLGYEVFLSDKGSISEENKKDLDRLEIQFEEGSHDVEKVLNCDFLVKSPGIPDNAEIVMKAVSAGIEVISEPEFASRNFNGKIIAITGTNGKTTTTLLTYHLLKEAGLNVGLAGNVGISFARQVALEAFDIYVVEMSSFQLDGIIKFRPDIAILLNITPDHLDRYENDFSNYIDSKFKITQNLDRGGHFIYNYDDRNIKSRFEDKKSFFSWPFSLLDLNASACLLNERELHFNCLGTHTLPLSESPLIGKHNICNTMAAILAGHLSGVAYDVLQRGLKSFVNAEHRLEKVLDLDGVAYINDSKATNVDSVYYALEGVSAPIIWIAGGIDKGNDYKALYPFTDKIKALICLGLKNEKLKKAFESRIPTVEEFDNIKKAVARAQKLAESGDTILLSPACASFDLFKNYIDRGIQFKEAVNELNLKSSAL